MVIKSNKPSDSAKEGSKSVAGSVLVERHYPGGKNESKQLSIKTFSSEPASVSVMLGVTKNIGDHEFGKVSISVTLPCYREEIDAAKAEASELAAKYLSEEAEQLSGSSSDEAEEEAVEEDDEDEKPKAKATKGKPAAKAKADDDDEDDDSEDDADDEADDDAEDDADDDEDEAPVAKKGGKPAPKGKPAAKAKDEDDEDEDDDSEDDSDDEEDEDEKPKAKASKGKAKAKDDDDEDDDADDEEETSDDEDSDDEGYTKEQLEAASVDDLKAIYEAWDLGKFPKGTPKDIKKTAIALILKTQG